MKKPPAPSTINKRLLSVYKKYVTTVHWAIKAHQTAGRGNPAIWHKALDAFPLIAASLTPMENLKRKSPTKRKPK